MLTELPLIPHPTACYNHPEPDLFFDEDRVEEARETCADCWFKTECRVLGAVEDYGVWGGKVASLPEGRDGEMIVLHRDEGMTRWAIATHLGIDRSVVYRALDGRLSPEGRKSAERKAIEDENNPRAKQRAAEAARMRRRRAKQRQERQAAQAAHAA